MRHVIGFIFALVVAAALFAGGGWGVGKIILAEQDLGGLASMSGGLAIAAVVGVGLLIGILLVVPAASPLATGLPGLAMLAWTGVLVGSASEALRLVPLHDAIGNGFQALLTSGALALLGAAMVIPMFLPSRWRRREPPDEFGPRPPTGLLQ
jgi:hypothetical protein